MQDIEVWLQRCRNQMAMRHLAVRTQRDYEQGIRGFLAFLATQGVTHPVDVTRDLLEAYGRHLLARRFRGQPLAPSTRTVRICAVRLFLRCVAMVQHLPFDVEQALVLPRVPRVLPPHLLSEAEVRRLLESLSDRTPLEVRNRCILEVLYGTGVRNAELRALNVEHVQLLKRQLRVVRGKRGNDRVLPLGAMALDWLRRYLTLARPQLLGPAAAGAPALFVASSGQRLSTEGLCDMVTRAATRAGLSVHVHPHLLRYACASHMLAHGAGLRQLQAFLGHQCLESTWRYALVDTSSLQAMQQRCHPRERSLTHELGDPVG